MLKGGDIRIGLVGLDTPHCLYFIKILNDPANSEYVPGGKIVAGFKGGSPDIPESISHVDEYTRQLSANYHVKIYDSMEALATHVDAIMIESIDGRPHLEEAKHIFPFGKPVFIDKPLAGSLHDAIEIVRLGRHYAVPFFSASSLRYRPGMAELKGAGLGELRGAFSYGPAPLEPHHPDLYWYGIHAVEGLYTVMGTGCQTVTRTHTEDSDVVTGVWAGGRVGTVRGMRNGIGSRQYGVIAFGANQVRQDLQAQTYRPLLVEIIKFFQTKVSPVSPTETIEILAFMEAADESKRRGGAPVSLADVLKANGNF